MLQFQTKCSYVSFFVIKYKRNIFTNSAIFEKLPLQYYSKNR